MTGVNARLRCGGLVWGAVCVGLSWAVVDGGSVCADEFEVTLQIQRGKQKTLATSRLPVGEQVKAGDAKTKAIIKSRKEISERKKARPRSVFHVHADQTVWISWQVIETGSSGTFKDLLVHVFAVAEAKAGQAETPKLTDHAAYESALTMDFKPKDLARGRFQLKFDRPGTYLVRAETIGLAGKLGHEFHAAADVEVDRAEAAEP